jgi:peptide/nickel transport system substrate-binding protein/microcin C transport system substrate-binding protein
LTAEDYVQKANSPKWGKDVFKVKIENKAPKGYGFIGWNMKNEMFQSKKVRLAMFHLINREDMIKKFRYGYGKPATGPWYMQSEYADTSVKAIEFDPKKALEILNADGWKDTDGDKILDKEIGGKKVKLSFTILEPNQEFIKYLTVFKEDAKQAGVDVNVKFVEWNTFIKLLDEKNFEAVRLAWSGGSVDLDPKQIWHSESANGGSNFINYSNPQVDKLIDEARETLDKKQRIAKLKKVYRMIADDVPYAFFFNDDAGFYGHTKRLKRVKDTYQYGVGLSYWWIGE